MGRKKVAKPRRDDDEFDEEEAIAIYSKPPYVPPDNTGLETIFEANIEDDAVVSTSSRGGRAAKAKLPAKLRLLQTRGHWIEDKDKDRLRQKMVNKLFKGRKKIRWRGLSEVQEQKLLNTIADLDEEEEEHQMDYCEDEDDDGIVQDDAKLPFIMGDSPALSSTSPCLVSLNNSTKEDDVETSPKSSSAAEDNVIDNDVVEDEDEDENIFYTRAIQSVLKRSRVNSVPRRGSTLFRRGEEPPTPVKDSNHEEEIAKQIRGADSFFGPIGFDDEDEESSNQQPEKQQQPLVQVRVRRSSRFFASAAHSSKATSDNSENLGTVYKDVELKNRRVSRRSHMFLRPNLTEKTLQEEENSEVQSEQQSVERPALTSIENFHLAPLPLEKAAVMF